MAHISPGGGPPSHFENLKSLATPKLTFGRFVWGASAGIVIALITAVGPGQQAIGDYLAQNGNQDELYYLIGAAIMQILLAIFSAPFCPWNIPYRILIFCAAIPGVITSVQSETFQGVTQKYVQTIVDATFNVGVGNVGGWFISSAVAQAISSDTCSEANTFSKIGEGIKSYLTFEQPADRPHYGVVAYSTTSLDEAILLTNSIDGFDAYVGCKRPGNDYFPVMISPSTTLERAQVIADKYKAEATSSVEPFVSYYRYRVPLTIEESN